VTEERAKRHNAFAQPAHDPDLGSAVFLVLSYYSPRVE
jgi:hypothetical protein